MLRFLKRLFSSSGAASTLSVQNFSLTSKVKLNQKVETPGGSRITVVTPVVDIWYSIGGNAVRIHKVRLAKDGTTIMGSSRRHNMASYVGEAFYAQGVCDESALREAVEKEMATGSSPLRRLMFAKWKDECGESLVRPLIDALNGHASPDEIASLLARAGRGTDVAFTYIKPDDNVSVRRVSVEGMSGDSLRALDHADDTVKSFRLDRISNASAL